MEIWEEYLEDGTLAGLNLIRGEKVPNGLYHLVCEVLVKHKDGTYLLMQRDFNKPNYPGLFEASAGGSALKGEYPLEAAIRELREETGITSNELVQIYKVLGNHSIYYGYICEVDCDKDSITLQEEETIDYLWIEEKKLIEFIYSDKYVPSHRERILNYWK